jgi:DNA-binding response OmpR family regulator
VADADSDAAHSLAQFLALLRFDARAATTPLDVVRLAAAQRPDAAILDLGWPGPDGCALAGAVCRAAGRRPLLVALTGRPGQEARCRAAGFDRHLLKPADPAALARAIRDHVGPAL